MKLVGKVNSIKRVVAQRSGNEMEREKRGFTISLKPPTPVGSYYSYGSMNFYLNGRDLEDFPVDLNDDVDIFLVKAGGAGGEFNEDELRHELAKAKYAQQAAEDHSAGLQKRYDEAVARGEKHRSQMAAAATVNAQLMAQIEALKLGRSELSSPPVIEWKGDQ